MSNRFLFFAAITAIATSARSGEDEHLRPVPFVFVGSASDCGTVPGSGNGLRTPAPQDPAEWTRVRFANGIAAYPPIPPGSTIESITLITDEGTDVATPDDPQGVGSRWSR